MRFLAIFSNLVIVSFCSKQWVKQCLFLSSQHRLRPADFLAPRNISRKSLSDVLEEHYEHRKQQVVDLFDKCLKNSWKIKWMVLIWSPLNQKSRIVILTRSLSKSDKNMLPFLRSKDTLMKTIKGNPIFDFQ